MRGVWDNVAGYGVADFARIALVCNCSVRSYGGGPGRLPTSRDTGTNGVLGSQVPDAAYCPAGAVALPRRAVAHTNSPARAKIRSECRVSRAVELHARRDRRPAEECH